MSKKNNRSIYFFSIIAVALLAQGCSLFPQSDKVLQPPLTKPVQVNYQTTEVKKGTITQTVQGTATFEASKYAYEQFTQGGYRVKSVDVKQGDYVHQGQVLMQLDDSGLELELLQRQISLDKAELAVKKALNSSNSIERDMAEKEYKIAKLQLDSSEANIKVRRLTADMNGVVTFVSDVKQGDIIRAYDRMVTIADPSTQWLAFNTLSDITNVDVGMNVSIKYKGKDFTGKVVQTPISAPTTENPTLSKKYQNTIYIRPDKSLPHATLGDFASISIITQQKKNALIIPRDALRTFYGNHFVDVMNGQSRKQVSVKVGILTDTDAEVINGLKEGQKVIVK